MNQTINLTETSHQAREAYLVPIKGGIPISIEGVMTVGRDPENDICLTDPHISLRHCQLEKRPHGIFIRDLKSRNGVRLNGLRIAEGQLTPGTEVQIGSTDFVFQTQQPDKPTNLPLKSRNSNWMTTIQSMVSVAKTNLPVFLEGESGTGKEVVAHIVHDHSDRDEGPFVSVNCSALTESLVESELFGHIKGSYTGATCDRKGAFEAARGGTLFLDEIGDLPLSLQPKLLRALENHEIRPVGSDKTVETDVRIVTATHKNLEKLVTENKFRADLYFRIHVVKISIPALRERMEDFDDLLYYFAREMRVRFSVAAITALKNHTWPGNIRELKNAVSRAHALYPQMQIMPEHIKNLVQEPFPAPEQYIFNPGMMAPGQGSILKEVEKEMIKSRLAANNGNQRKTAADLGMPKSTLHDRIKAYNLTIS